jgi:hypothetical protein
MLCPIALWESYPRCTENLTIFRRAGWLWASRANSVSACDPPQANGDHAKADLIRKLAKDRFRAFMTYGMNRSFARCLTDEEVLAFLAQKDRYA